jgi:hypothetical protein
LRWSVVNLSKASGAITSTIKRMEADNGVPNSTVPNLKAIQSALESAGIEIISSPDNRPGIRIRSRDRSY